MAKSCLMKRRLRAKAVYLFLISVISTLVLGPALRKPIQNFPHPKSTKIKLYNSHSNSAFFLLRMDHIDSMSDTDSSDGTRRTDSIDNDLHPAFVITPGYVDEDVTIDMVEPSIYEDSTYLASIIPIRTSTTSRTNSVVDIDCHSISMAMAQLQNREPPPSIISTLMLISIQSSHWHLEVTSKCSRDHL